MGLIEKMFESKVVRMGPSRNDPSRQVATFNPDAIRALASRRSSELNTFRWLIGQWTYENPVPATPVSPEYCDVGSATFKESADAMWICMVGPDGREFPLLTFDAWSNQWIYVLTNGAYGILRSPGWTGNDIAFRGAMTMVGVNCEWRMTWTRRDNDAFSFVNEELAPDGSWIYIDEWQYRRKPEIGAL
jgi:hypothetical protein